MAHVMLIAGEPSGDQLGGRLMVALTDCAEGKIRFAGIGGEAMTAHGLNSLFDMSELSVMGLAEVLPRVRALKRRLKETRAAALDLRPDVLVTIDSPGFSFRLAKSLVGHGIPLVHYVAPTVWAWRPGRAKKIAAFLDHLIVLLPFEPPYFEAHGLSCTFAGHPAIEGGAGRGDGAGFRERRCIATAAPLLAVLPGSRRMELLQHLPIFEETIARLRQEHRDLAVVVPAAPGVSGAVMAAVGRWPGRNLVVLGDEEKFDAFAAADTALAVSGTVALELGLAGTPAVIAYRANPFTAAIVRRLVKVNYASLVNLLMEREVQPELLQENCRPERLAAAVREFLNRTPVEDMSKVAAELNTKLRAGAKCPSATAAEAILEVVRASKGG